VFLPAPFNLVPALKQEVEADKVLFVAAFRFFSPSDVRESFSMIGILFSCGPTLLGLYGSKMVLSKRLLVSK
jgi:hypothetical protein